MYLKCRSFSFKQINPYNGYELVFLIIYLLNTLHIKIITVYYAGGHILIYFIKIIMKLSLL